MDWIMTVPLQFLVIFLGVKLPADKLNAKAWTFGLGPDLVVDPGCYGELVVTECLVPRWIRWVVSATFFLYIAFGLVVGPSAATKAVKNEGVENQIKLAQIMTVISWCTYPVACLLPLFDIKPGAAVVGGKGRARPGGSADAATPISLRRLPLTVTCPRQH